MILSATSQYSAASTDCMICGEAMRQWMSVKSPLTARDHQLRWCPSCRMGSVIPRPSAEELAFHYNTDYYTHGNRIHGHRVRSLNEKLRIRIAWMEDRGKPLTAGTLMALAGSRPRVVEIGCGSGALLESLAHRGATAIGVEPDAMARKAASERQLRVLAGTAEELPAQFQRRAFDLAVMCHVLEHCLDPLAAVRNAAELLAPRGFLVVEVSNNEATGLRYSGVSWRWLDVPRHVNFFTRHSLRKLAERCGLRVLSTEFCGYCRQFSDEWIQEEKPIAREQNSGRVPSAWLLLARTVGAPAPHKYDSVRIIARRN